jgi:sugar (pentulose or hexulose) kinase
LKKHRLTGSEVLAIDAGTQGISVVLWCPDRKVMLGVGEADYEQAYIPGLSDGRLEQYAHYWSDAMKTAMQALRADLQQDLATVAGIGVTGHMHCMVKKTTDERKPFGCDMWNDPRGVSEGEELSRCFGEHIPSRWTASHILASLRSDPDSWSDVTGVSVTSGSLVHDLTGEWVLGPGDASGMFGVLGEDGQIDRNKLRLLEEASGIQGPLSDWVPRIVPAGEVAGVLNEAGSALLGGLPVGIPVAAPEGDQQSVLMGAGAEELELALSAGTSFTGNISSSAHMKAESETVNVLHTPDGETMLMVCARNGTVGFANYVSGLAELSGLSFSEMADRLTDRASALPLDVYGVELLPFFQGENVEELPYAKASVHEAPIEFAANPGIMARLLLEAPCMTMRYGIEKLKPRIGRLKRVLLSGGALKSKGGYAPQLYADILGVPVLARMGDEEGTAKGAAILAAFMVKSLAGEATGSLGAFAKSQCTGEEKVWTPDPAAMTVFDDRYLKFESRIQSLQQTAG